MVAIATENFESELKFGESSGVMRFDPASIDFDSKWSTIAETRLFTVNQKWMFGELTVSYPLSFSMILPMGLVLSKTSSTGWMEINRDKVSQQISTS